MRPYGREGGYQEHQIADFLEFQWEDTTEKGNDVDRIAECDEHPGDQEEAGLDHDNEKAGGVGGKWGIALADKRSDKSDSDSETEHEQKHSEERDHEPADHGVDEQHQKDQGGHNAKDKDQIEPRFAM